MVLRNALPALHRAQSLDYTGSRKLRRHRFHIRIYSVRREGELALQVNVTSIY
jgi:hypothetical protein